MAGKNTARALYNIYSGASADLGYEAKQRGATAESERAAIESRLGTSEQAAGTGDFASDPRVGNYAARYTLSPYAGAGGKKGPTSAQMTEKMTGANSLLDKAEEAARNGQFDIAENFKNQAQAGLSNWDGVPSGAFQEFFNLERDPQKGATSTLSSPTARIVGQDVLRADQIRDPNSPAYRELYNSIVEPGSAEIEAGYTKAGRSIAQGLATSRRDVTDMAAGRGAGRNALGEMNLMARVNESANSEIANARLDADVAKAKLFGDATKFLISYGDEFRRNTVAYARDWVNGAPYVRDAYVNSQNSMSQFAAQIFQQQSSEQLAISQAAEAKSDARAAYYRNLIIAAATVVVSAGIGAVAGAAGLVTAGAGGWTGAAAGAGVGVKTGAVIAGAQQGVQVKLGGSP